MMNCSTKENRYIVINGLDRIKNKFFLGLVRYQAFKLSSGIDQLGIAFYITPLINGMVRSGTQEEKEMMFEAFINPDKKVITGKRGHKGEEIGIVDEVIRLCVNAKARQQRLLDKMEEVIDGRIMEQGLLDNRILVVELTDEDDFPSEINGLLATRLVSKYQRPVLIGRVNSEGFLRGSVRGVNGSELESTKDFLDETEMFEYTAG